ncbi:MAG TPA: phosphatase PAP2 family protein [Gemmatimonadaceae bacterium]|nr:phosphatase PAP2 family protein [Gemmatimonadaceae bacterium]
MLSATLFTRLADRDRALFARCLVDPAGSRSQRLFWTVITHLGGVSCSVLTATVPLFLGGAIADAARQTVAMLVFSHLVVQVVKRTVNRPRPSNALDCVTLVVEPDRFSFPSGHSAAAMAVAFGYAMAFPSLAAPLIAIALLVGASRVFLGVHYPGDVLVGQLIAVLTGLAWHLA